MRNKFDTNMFIKKAYDVHGDRYDYSKVEYVNKRTKVCIICPEHGEFWQTPQKHLYDKQNCPLCSKENAQKGNIKKNKLAKQTFVQKANIVHNNGYDYSVIEYINCYTPITIIHKKCGNRFRQTPSNHLHGCGCPICGIKEGHDKLTSTTNQFIEKSMRIHGNKYDYSKVNYINNHTNVCIICHEHGEFWQTPSRHLQGYGCYNCHNSLLENEVYQTLIHNNFDFIQQQQFDWLGKLRIDFFLPIYNIGIECQGIQHFEPVDYFGGITTLKKIQNRDSIKLKLCNEHDIKIIYYANYNYNFPYKVLTNKDELLSTIVNKL